MMEFNNIEQPLFTAIHADHIHIVKTEKQYKEALAEMLKAGVVGFDTETNHKKARDKCGPHLFQFALRDKVYLFQNRNPETYNGLILILTNKKIKKIGFDLASDRKLIMKNLGVSLEGEVDMVKVMNAKGFSSKRQTIGLVGAIGILLGQTFKKSKSVCLSAWDCDTLTLEQIIYAGNDAYAALRCYLRLEEIEGLQEVGQKSINRSMGYGL